MDGGKGRNPNDRLAEAIINVTGFEDGADAGTIFNSVLIRPKAQSFLRSHKFQTLAHILEGFQVTLDRADRDLPLPCEGRNVQAPSETSIAQFPVKCSPASQNWSYY